MNFYRSALDGMVRHPDDQSSVGIILCKSKSGLVAEYSLRDMSKPIGVSEYRLTSRLPEGLSGQLPSPQELRGFWKRRRGGWMMRRDWGETEWYVRFGVVKAWRR